MTDFEYMTSLHSLLTEKQANLPTVVTTTLASTPQGRSQLQLATAPANPDDYVGGLLEITSGDASGKYFTIYRIVGDVVELNGFIERSRLPDAGDSVRLSGGPLSEAVVYIGPPVTIEQQVNSGKKFFVFIDVPSSSTGFSALVGKRPTSKAKKEVTYSTQILVATPDNTGVSNDPDSVRDSYYQLHRLKDQVMYLCEMFRHDTKNQLRSSSDMTCEFEKIDFPGFMKNGLFRAVIIEFDATVSL